MRFRIAMLCLLVLLASLAPAGVVQGEHGPWDGYCDGDTPVITHPPPSSVKWGVTCYEGSITITYPPPGPPEKSVPMPEPADFYMWIFVYINGERAGNPYNDVNPYIAKSSGRTMIPIRFVTEALGGKAEWFESERKVRLTWKDKYMEMIIGKAEAVANGRVVELDQPPIIVRDRTVVPARAVAEAFGADVVYMKLEQRVSITLEGAECPRHICD